MNDENSKDFKYSRLTDLLRNRILSLPSGSHLPSQRALMKRYGLSLQTVSMALRQLESEKLISIKDRSGIFVSHERDVRLIVFHRARHSSTLIDGKEESLRRAFSAVGWHLMVCRYEANPTGKDIFGEPNACAHVVNADMVDDAFPFLQQILRQGVPVLALAREPDAFRMDYLTSDEPEMMMSLVDHLRSLGHQRIAFLVNEPCFYEVRERVVLFESALKQLGMPTGTVIDCETKPWDRSSVQAYRGLLNYLTSWKGNGKASAPAAPPALPFTALITSSARGGAPALRAFYDCGYRVPDDCSLATFGDQPQENNIFCVPSLTGVDAPMDAWGDAVVKLLQQRFGGDTSLMLGRRVPTVLVARESTSAPSGQVQPDSPAPVKSRKRKVPAAAVALA